MNERSVWAGPPQHVSMSLTDRCHLKCATCCHSWIDNRDCIDIQVPVERLRYFLENAHTVALHGTGEVLMYPQLWELLPDRLPDASNVGWVTTGHLLSASAIQKILERNIAWLNFSIHGGTPETYHKVHGASFTHVWSRIDALVTARGDRTRPLLVANVMLMSCNVRELPEIVRLASEHGLADVRVYHMNPADIWQGNGRWADSSDGFNYDNERCIDKRVESQAILAAAHVAKEVGIPLLGIGNFLGSRWDHADLRNTVV